ncbi:hypothetical protein SAMN05444422_10128 [Halobiforma haloterrestris]|uniref:Uncharacterized protein n=1 Tax=Natronobacterium haloterrestre TaxID=148448 RepID=A0A1I1CXH7_NATHA|nr:hypothetical protein SAMN05444422_10128 [Halobiforma haloterrestris]
MIPLDVFGSESVAADLFEQVRGATLRDECLEWNHAFVGWRGRATLARYDF